jgi:hypothetical protein
MVAQQLLLLSISVCVREILIWPLSSEKSRSGFFPMILSLVSQNWGLLARYLEEFLQLQLNALERMPDTMRMELGNERACELSMQCFNRQTKTGVPGAFYSN